jgi:hypothetical protein
MRTFEIIGVAVGYEGLTTATAIGFTAAKLTPTTGNFAGMHARAVIISVDVADIRMTLDGTTPVITATGGGVGHLIPYTSSIEIRGESNLKNFLCINAVNASGALVKCTFFF